MYSLNMWNLALWKNMDGVQNQVKCNKPGIEIWVPHELTCVEFKNLTHRSLEL